MPVLQKRSVLNQVDGSGQPKSAIIRAFSTTPLFSPWPAQEYGTQRYIFIAAKQMQGRERYSVRHLSVVTYLCSYRSGTFYHVLYLGLTSAYALVYRQITMSVEHAFGVMFKMLKLELGWITVISTFHGDILKWIIYSAAHVSWIKLKLVLPYLYLIAHRSWTLHCRLGAKIFHWAHFWVLMRL